MVVYISGGITGVENYGKAFERAEEKLKAAGHEVINPARLEEYVPQLTYEGYMIVYVLVNFNSTIEEDLERIYTLRDIGYDPYVMIYEKAALKRGHIIRKMQRWCNCKWIFHKTERFEDYDTRVKGQ